MILADIKGAKGIGQPKEFRGLKTKEKEWAKLAENFYGLDTSYGKLLLVYFMRPPDLEAFVVMRPLIVG